MKNTVTVNSSMDDFNTLTEASGRICEPEDRSKAISLAHKFNNLNERDQFLKNHKLPKFNVY